MNCLRSTLVLATFIAACGPTRSATDAAADVSTTDRVTVVDVVDAGSMDAVSRDVATLDVAADTMGTDAVSADASDVVSADAFDAADATDAADASDASDAAVPDAGPTPCPRSAPTAGDPCTVDDLECSYGDDPRLACRPTFQCQGGAWADTTASCPVVPACPSTPPNAGSTCGLNGTVCLAADGTRCRCSNCVGTLCMPSYTWHCSDPITDPACPATAPNLGDACASTGTSCDYGACVGGYSVTCDDATGTWQRDHVFCP